MADGDFSGFGDGDVFETFFGFGDGDVGDALFNDPGGTSIPSLDDMPVQGGGVFLPPGDPYMSTGLGGDVGIGDDLSMIEGGATANVNGYDPDFAFGSEEVTGSGTPADMTSGQTGGSFNSIAGQASSLWKGIGGLLNPISTALTGKPIISTGAATTAAAQQKQMIQNVLVVAAVGVGGYFLLKKV